MWQGIDSDALIRAAAVIALHGLKIPTEERLCIIAALTRQAHENDIQNDMGVLIGMEDS